MGSARRIGRSLRPFRIVFPALLVFILAAASVLAQLTYTEPASQEVGSRFFTIVSVVTLENRNDKGEVWNLAEDERALGLFLNTSWQKVYLANISYSVERFGADLDRNPEAYLPESGIRCGENFTYEVAYRVVLKPRSTPEVADGDSGILSDIPGDLRSLYCRSGGPWQVDDPVLRALAYEIAENETRVLTILRKFVVWISRNIRYGSADVPRYPNETFSEKAGDCDDQANLLATFCRVVGIPAYLQLGCIYIPTKASETHYWNGSFVSKLTRIGWHGWAMVYVPPWGWLPFDLTYTGSDLRTNPLDAVRKAAIIAHPTVQYANVVMMDYVAASRDWRDFLVAHGYRVFEHDEMYEEVSGEGATETTGGLRPRRVIVSRLLPFPSFLPV